MTFKKRLFLLYWIFSVCVNFLPAQIEIIVPETTGVDRFNEPITLGVPFEQGQISNTEQLTLHDPSGIAVPAQFQVMANWRDGSIRWLKCDFQATVGANQQAIYLLELSGGNSPNPAIAIETEETEDILRVNTGLIQFEVSRNDFALIENVFLDENRDGQFQANEQIITKSSEGFVVQQDENRYNSVNNQPISISFEEIGPLKVVIKAEGRHYDDAGNYLLKYETRIYAYANQPFIKVRHSYANGTSVPSLGNSASEEFGESIDLYEIGLPVNLSEEKEVITSLDGSVISTPHIGGELQLFQKDRPTVDVPFIAEVTNEDAVIFNGERADGWLAIQDERWGMQVVARHFWEKYPKGLKWDANDNFVIQPIPTAEFLYAAMGAGEEFVLHFYESDQDQPLADFANAMARQPIIPYVSTAQHIQSGAFYDLYASGQNQWDNMESYINTITDNHLTNRERLDLYGNLHFGDVPRDQWEVADDRSFSTWGNNYYDCVLSNARLFAQTGDPRYYNIMLPMARHFMETQCFQTYDPNDWMNGYSPAYSIHHRGVDHYNQHYGEGIWYYYYLTGDERAKEIGLRAARSIRDAHIWGLNNPNVRLAYQNASACLEAWKATGDESFLEVTRIYIKDRIFTTQNVVGQIGGYREEGGLDFPGAQTFMMALFSDTAWKYLKEFPEEDSLKAQFLKLADFIDQYARVNTGEEDYYNFWYSPADPQAPRVFRSNTADDFVFWNGKALIAGLYAYAYDLSGEDRYRTMGVNLMDYLWNSAYGNAFGFFAWGKASSQAMKNSIHAAAILNLITTSTEEVTEKSSFDLVISPNPAVHAIRVLNIDQMLPYIIYTNNGQVIQSGHYIPGQDISVEHLQAGLYLLQIGKQTNRFLKHDYRE